MTPAILATGTDRRPSLALAAAIAVEAAEVTSGATLLIEAGAGAQRRGATLLAASAAREVEDALRGIGLPAAARGHLCHLALADPGESMSELAAAIPSSGAELALIHVPGPLWVPALEARGLGAVGGCVLVGLPEERSLAALAVDELRRRSLRARIATRHPAPLAARRALAGVRPGGRTSELASRILRALLGLGHGGQTGQALPAVLAAGLALIACALVLAAIGGAVTGKGRVQRAADLAALSAARSMRDDIPRLLAPALLPDGAPNPRHLSRGQYLARARLAAVDAAIRNQVDPARLRIAFPDAAADPPLQARAAIRGEIDPGELPGGERLDDRRPIAVVATAVAEASPPVASWTGMSSDAVGGGYSGPLAYRNGEPSRSLFPARVSGTRRMFGYAPR